MGRVLSILAVILVFSSNSAQGLELEWPNGQHDLTVTTAEPCTLFVKSSPTDTLFNFPWRLVWAGTAETAAPLVVLRAPGTEQLPGPSVVSSGSTIDSIAHSTTAVFDIPNTVTHPDVAMYLLRIDPTMRARLTLAPMSMGASSLIRDYGRTEVTVNGGSDVPYAPVVCSVRRVGSEPLSNRSVAKNSAVLSAAQNVQLSGLDLSGVTAVSLLRASQTNAPEPLSVVGQTDSTLTVELPADLGTEQAVITLARPDGVTTAAVLPSSLVPESSAQTYHLGCAADSAFMPATFAIDPTTETYGLQYSHEEAGKYYYSVQDGAWRREQLPSDVPMSWGEKSMCIDKEGIVHVIGNVGGYLTHMWRPSGASATWSSETLRSNEGIGKAIIQVDTTTNALELAYTLAWANYRFLMWTRRDSIGVWWSEAVFVEGGGQVVDFDFIVGPDGAGRIAYEYDSLGVYLELRYKTRSLQTGSWPQYTPPIWGVIAPIGISLSYDPINGPLIAYVDYYDFNDPLQLAMVAFIDYRGWWWDCLSADALFSCWKAVACASPQGAQHVCLYEAPGNGWPSWELGRVMHASRQGFGGGLFGRWGIDTVVVSNDARLGTGWVENLVGCALLGETPLIGFDYLRETMYGSQLYMASTEPVAAVGRKSVAPGLVLNGPWPNPVMGNRVVRMSVESDRHELIKLGVFDVMGKCVMKQERVAEASVGGSVRWDVGGLPAGVYWVRAKAASGREVIRKWVLIR